MEKRVMKRDRALVGPVMRILVTSVFVAFVASTALGGSHDKGPPKSSKPPSEEKTPPEATAEQPADPGGDLAKVDARYGNPLKLMEARRQVALTELDLSEEEVERFNAKFEEELDKIKEVMRTGEKVRQEHAGRLAELRSEMKEAHEAGDGARAQSLFRDILTIEQGPARIRKKMIGVDARLAEALPEAKRETYLELASRAVAKLMPKRRPAGFSAVLWTLGELDLSAEQWTKINQARRELSKALSQAHGARDYELMARVEAEFRKRSLDALSQEELKRYLEAERKHEKEDGWEFKK